MVRHRRGGGNFGLVLLGAQLVNFGLDRIPPATLALIVGQTAIFLNFIPKYFSSANRVCVSSYLVFQHRDWQRMILSTFYHAHDMHLYFNMISLLYKGTFLERKFGTRYFVYLVTVFTVLCSATYVGLGLLLSELLGDQSYLMSCAVGFSGVLFALKVLATFYSPAGTQYVFGFVPVPSKYIFWAELILIQMVTKNASFVGHLAGILVGLAYVQGPLKLLMDAFYPSGNGDRSHSGNTTGYRQHRPHSSHSSPNFRGDNSSRFHHNTRHHTGESSQPRPSHYASTGPNPGGEYATPSAPPDEEGDFSQNYGGGGGYDGGYSNRYAGGNPQTWDHNRYTGGLDEEDQYRFAMEESLREHSNQPGSSNRMYPDLDELRARRDNFYATNR